MNINIDYQSRTPIYEQVVLEVEKLVALDILHPDEQIPSIRDLACTLGVNPNTIKKAYDVLEQKGIIISKSTKGTFIASNITKAKKEKINTILKEIQVRVEELKRLGITTETIKEKIK